MKKLLLIGVLCFLPFPVHAAQAENAIYERSRDASGVLVRAQSGREVQLGTRRTLQVMSVEMFSENDENSRFYVSVTFPYDPSVVQSHYILFVDGTAYEQVGSGSSQNETSSLHFDVTGDSNAEQVAKYFGTSVRYRRHPDHHLRVSFMAAKEKFDTGEEVIVTLRITNLGPTAVSFMQGGRNRAARDNQYVFSARYLGKQVEDVGNSSHFGGLAVRRVLKPGDVFEDKVSLKKWFSFREPGVYEIHGSYYLAFQDPEDSSWRTIWEDYASADFAVTIKER